LPVGLKENMESKTWEGEDWRSKRKDDFKSTPPPDFSTIITYMFGDSF
jgi:hypothetical protein